MKKSTHFEPHAREVHQPTVPADRTGSTGYGLLVTQNHIGLTWCPRHGTIFVESTSLGDVLDQATLDVGWSDQLLFSTNQLWFLTNQFSGIGWSDQRT